MHGVLDAPLRRAQADVGIPRDVDAVAAYVRSLYEQRPPATPATAAQLRIGFRQADTSRALSSRSLRL